MYPEMANIRLLVYQPLVYVADTKGFHLVFSTLFITLAKNYEKLFFIMALLLEENPPIVMITFWLSTFI